MMQQKPTSRSSAWQTVFIKCGRILAGVPIVVLLGVGLLFLVFSVTWKGHLLGLAAVLFAGLLYCLVDHWNRPWFQKRKKQILFIALALIALLLSGPLILAPTGQGSVSGRVQNRFLKQQHGFVRFSPWNVIPEMDQESVHLTLAPFVDPFVDRVAAREIASLKMPIYEEMETDPDFYQLGSVMGLAYRERARLSYNTGHYFSYVSETTDQEKLPCFIFLHGIGGNKKTHFWAMTGLADHMKCVVIAPTFGMGYWQNAGGAQLVVDVAEEAIATLPVDPQRVYLIGYSQGAVGVTRAALLKPELFDKLIYISPVTEDGLLSSPEFASHYKSRSLLFLHGENDKRIPRLMVEGTASSLRMAGFDARIQIYEGEGHSMILSQRESIAQQIAEFVNNPVITSERTK